MAQASGLGAEQLTILQKGHQHMGQRGGRSEIHVPCLEKSKRAGNSREEPPA